MDYYKLNCIEVRQNIGSFYLTKMTPQQLHVISNSDLSRYQNAEDGIQREISKSRTKAISKYLSETEAAFPNTIIVSITKNPASDHPEYILEDGPRLLVKAEDGVANILDGQHRLSGFSKEEEAFELPVSIFLDLSIGQQAMIFSKINSTQVKVSLDLVYELFDITDGRSTQKTSYSVVKALNTELKSPWYKKIKTLTERTGDIAQGSFAKYIDKELISEGKILNNLFLEERDVDLQKMLSNYFQAVKENFKDVWINEDSNYILTKTTGFNGFMFFFKDLVLLARNSGESLSFDYFNQKISIVLEKFKPLTSDNYESGAKGQNKIRDILRSGLSEDEKSKIGIK